jgi:hypothetical protein
MKYARVLLVLTGGGTEAAAVGGPQPPGVHGKLALAAAATLPSMPTRLTVYRSGLAFVARTANGSVRGRVDGETDGTADGIAVVFGDGLIPVR